MIVETKIEFREYLKLNYLLTYRKPIMIFISIIGLMMLTASVLYFLGVENLYEETPILPITFASVIILYLPFSVYRATKKNYYSHERLQEVIIYEFTDDKIIISGDSFKSEMDWTKTYKILELKNWLLIYQNKATANIIPKESFGNNFKEFKQLIKSKNIKMKLKK